MLWNRIILTSLFTILLIGCASRPRAELSDFGYQYASQAYATVQRCGIAGYIDPGTASLGTMYVKAKYFTGVSVDQARFSGAVQQLLNSARPTTEECNQLAMDIHQRKREIGAHNEMVKASEEELRNITNNRPKQTYCNRVGTQTLCTTY